MWRRNKNPASSPKDAHAKDPVRMARAMNLACQAGRDAFLSGRIPKRLYASASSPEEGVLLKILTETGKSYALGAPIAVVGEKGEEVDLSSLTQEAAAPAAAEVEEPVAAEPASTPAAVATAAAEPQQAVASLDCCAN